MSGNGSKILIVDIDDVVLDWTASFDKYIRKFHGYDGVPLGENPKRLPDILNCSREKVISIMEEHNTSSRFKNLKNFKDSKELLLLNTYFEKVYSITSCGKSDQIRQNRLENLMVAIPCFIDELICLDFYEHKHEEIIEIINNHKDSEIYMLDDNVIDIEFAISKGVNGIVYKSAFYDSKGLITVNSCKEFIRYIKSE